MSFAIGSQSKTEPAKNIETGVEVSLLRTEFGKLNTTGLTFVSKRGEVIRTYKTNLNERAETAEVAVGHARDIPPNRQGDLMSVRTAIGRVKGKIDSWKRGSVGSLDSKDAELMRVLGSSEEFELVLDRVEEARKRGQLESILEDLPVLEKILDRRVGVVIENHSEKSGYRDKANGMAGDVEMETNRVDSLTRDGGLGQELYAAGTQLSLSSSSSWRMMRQDLVTCQGRFTEQVQPIKKQYGAAIGDIRMKCRV